MTSYLLHEHIRCCDVGDGAVFLDMKAQKYFALPASQCGALSDVVAGWPLSAGYRENPDVTPTDKTELIEQLLARGVLTPDEGRGHPFRDIAIRREVSVEFEGRMPSDPPVKFRQIITFIRAYASALGQFRFLSLHKIAERVSRLSRATDPARQLSFAEIRDLIRSFRRIRAFFYTDHGQCFFDSLVLLRFLQLSQIHATWVVGVATRPFGAHSWVQHQDAVLSDSLETVRRFEPIFTI